MKEIITGEVLGGHTPQYYDWVEIIYRGFMQQGYLFLFGATKKERNALYEYMEVKTASDALCKRSYIINFEL